MKITIVGYSGTPQRVTDLVALAADALESDGFDVKHIAVPRLGLPDSIATEHLDTSNSFVLTPGMLIESWRVARHLDSLTEPRERLLIVDYHGKGGIFALEQAMESSDSAREVWTLAGSSRVLGELDSYGVAVGSDDESVASIDWELVQYRFSRRVISMSDRAISLLRELKVDVERLGVRPPTTKIEPGGHGSTLAVPEPVSRRSHTREIMRGVVEVLVNDPASSVLVSNADDDDLVWAGTTWGTISYPGATADRIERVDDPASGGGTVILGDPFGVPSQSVVDAHARGAKLVVPEGSVAAALMPAAVVWSSEDQLANLIRTGTPPDVVDAAPTLTDVVPERTATDSTRARRVSVGIPVYSDIRFLRECVASVLDQTQTPHEVVLFDDGSHEPLVTDLFSELETSHRGLVRTMRGPNRGVCVSRNEMIASMSGDAFVLVDSDDLLHREFIQRCADGLRANTRVTAVATWTEFFGGYNGIEAKPPFTARVGLRENPIVSTAVLVDMSVRSHGITFAQDLAFLYCEDWHVWSQIVANGGSFGLIPRPLVRHRVHASSGATRRIDLAHRIGKQRATEPLVGGWPL
ncbi:MAG: hypothetical protein BMS9Abin12_2318 [Acidimicrobiia bacterium]|nr:MAG: hypothetical protein BMS9Abin12_2318 [Acidimicrobiia bacterium]